MPWPARVGVAAAAVAVSAGTATGEARASDPFAVSAAVGDLGAEIRQEVDSQLNEAFSRGVTGADAAVVDVGVPAADAAPETPAAVDGESSAQAPAASQPRPKVRHAIPPQHRAVLRQRIRVVAHAGVRSSSAYSESRSKIEISLRTRESVPRAPPPRRPRSAAPKAPRQPLPTLPSSDASTAVQGGHGSGLPLLLLLAALVGGLALYGMRHLLPPIPQAPFRKPRRSSLRPWRPG